MLTALGKELRKLRIDRGERLVDMGGQLRVSASFLSAIEIGTKAPPKGFELAVIKAYGLDEVAAKAIRKAADRSRTTFTIEARTNPARDAAAMFARKINLLSDQDLEQINAILNKENKDG